MADDPTEALSAPQPDEPASQAERRASGRTWPQRLTITGVLALAFLSFAAAGALAAGQWVVSSRNLVVLDTPTAATPAPAEGSIVVPDLDDGDDTAGDRADDAVTAPPPTFPPAEPDAKNFLVTGADGNACIDPDSRFAPAFGDTHQFGDRSDTIMVWRVNPGSGQVAVLSFPRDLYVSIDGGSRGRINTAYRRDDPERLTNTLFDNFGIRIDHYVQVDFCAFKRLVDAVGGVEVPFEFPARDSRTGLFVPEVGCYNFEGDHALAYVRSRRYQYEDPVGSGNWKTDGTSDLGRIARQQDFLRRTVSSVLDRGAYSPSVVSALIETNREYLTIDSELTLNRMLGFAGALRNLDPGAIASYQIESVPQTVAGNSVLIPRIDGDNMQAILAVFRGEATLVDAPEQEFDSTTSVPERPDPNSTTTSSTEPADEGDSTGSVADTPLDTTVDTLPEVEADENLLGVSPPRDVTC
ncbi:MAG: LytR family transcriptional regulator [Ilumatobacter sp.]|nr:MAG: LytR family transcriptional regulator [Ilumatobacter sp.]